jgi:HflK protein
MALTSLFSLILFLLGKYSAGVARLEGQRLLQPSASAMLMGSVCCLLVTLAEAAAWFGFPLVDRWTSRVLIIILGLVALEMAISLILEVYRPRVKGQATRLLYESRLIGLLGQPGGLITTAAQALDYQFGFKVSDTWFYQFLEKALAWLVLLQLGILALSTTIVIVEPNEQALLERLGSPVAGRNLLEPGLHFKWPWPIDIAHKYPTREVHTFYVGFVPDKDADKERMLLWTRPHHQEEFNLLVASRETVASSSGSSQSDQAVPVNMLAVNIPIQYQIRDLRSWAYQHVNGADLLDKLANREVVRYLVNVDIDDIMTTGRLKAATEIQQRIQAQADQNKLGVEILFVGLQSIHPPVTVAPAYEEVIGALQDKETNILGAQAYWIEKIPLANADATNLVTRAESDGLTKVTTAAADAAQFRNQMLAYSASPEVYRQRSYLETLVRAIRPARKYIIATTNTTETIWLNLEDKLRTDLLDVAVPKPR